eukprot:2832173-Pleurochrysis_carterae.AAC.2
MAVCAPRHDHLREQSSLPSCRTWRSRSKKASSSPKSRRDLRERRPCAGISRPRRQQKERKVTRMLPCRRSRQQQQPHRSGCTASEEATAADIIVRSCVCARAGNTQVAG